MKRKKIEHMLLSCGSVFAVFSAFLLENSVYGAGYYWTRGEELTGDTATASWFDQRNWQGGAWNDVFLTCDGWNMAPNGTGYLPTSNGNDFPSVVYSSSLKGPNDSCEIRPGFMNSGYVGYDTSELQSIEINKDPSSDVADKQNGIARATSVRIYKDDRKLEYLNTTPGFSGDGTLRLYTYQASTPTATTNAYNVHGEAYNSDFTFDVDVTISTWDGGGSTVNSVIRPFTDGHKIIFTDGHVLNINKNSDADGVMGSGTINILNYVNSTCDNEIIINSKVYADQFRLTNGNRTETNKYGTVTTLGGSESNEIRYVFMADTAVIRLAKQGSATVISQGSTFRTARGATVILDADGQFDHTMTYEFGNPFYAEKESSYYGVSSTLNLNGHSTTLGGILLDNQYASLYIENKAIIDFGETSGANTLTVTSVGANAKYDAYTDWENSSITFKNYELGEDHFYCAAKLSETEISDFGIYISDLLVFDGYSSEDFIIAENEVMIDGALYYEYVPVLIPEPSSIAAAFGALALLFAAYRRK